MDIIVKHFSKGVIASVGFLFLFSLLFQMPFLSDQIGLLSVLGTGMSSDVITIQRQPVLTKLKEQARLKVPVIEYQTNQPQITVNKSVDINQYFVACDYGNQTIPFTVVGIYNMQKQKEEAIYDTKTQTLHFQNAGIYQILLRTKDSTNRPYTYQFYIAVKREDVQ